MRELFIGLFLLSCPATVFVIFGTPGLEAFEDGAEFRINLPAAEYGRVAYLDACARCHGRSARGTERGPSLVEPAYWRERFSDARIHRAVIDGVAARAGRGGMPAVAGLPSQRIDVIVAFLRQAQALHAAR
jgi:mono/diheme cytochrome c family protein